MAGAISERFGHAATAWRCPRRSQETWAASVVRSNRRDGIDPTRWRLRQRPARSSARFAGLPARQLQHVLVMEYGPGAAIGWHRDKGVFGQMVGISLLSPCTFRLRRPSGTGFDRVSLTAEPRSAYLLSGPAREEWEHSIPGVDALRYSVTFRNLRES